MSTIYSAIVTLWVVVMVGLPLQAQAVLDTDQIIAAASRRLERAPNDRNNLITLGSAYIRKGRETGDSQYFGLAQDVLLRCAKLYPRDGVGRRHLAYVLSLMHDFAGSAREAADAIALNPQDADAYGLLGDARIELGDYDAAREAYAKMVGLQESLSTLSRRSGLHSLTGDVDAAVADLRRAITLGKAASEPPESIAWGQWQLGMEYAHVGRYKEAERAFRAALVTLPNYYRGHGGLALIHAARGEFRRAQQGYEAAMASVPLPEYAVALGHLYTRLGQFEAAAAQYALVEKLGQLGNDPYNREVLLFRLDRGENVAQVLELARRSMDLRKDIHGFDVLAWALFKNGQITQARDAIEQAMRLGTRDARLFHHAGMIYRALGQDAKARELLKRALATNPHFHLLHARETRQVLRTLSSSMASRAGRANTRG